MIHRTPLWRIGLVVWKTRAGGISKNVFQREYEVTAPTARKAIDRALRAWQEDYAARITRSTSIHIVKIRNVRPRRVSP